MGPSREENKLREKKIADLLNEKGVAKKESDFILSLPPDRDLLNLKETGKITEEEYKQQIDALKEIAKQVSGLDSAEIKKLEQVDIRNLDIPNMIRGELLGHRTQNVKFSPERNAREEFNKFYKLVPDLNQNMQILLQAMAKVDKRSLSSTQRQQWQEIKRLLQPVLQLAESNPFADSYLPKIIIRKKKRIEKAVSMLMSEAEKLSQMPNDTAAREQLNKIYKRIKTLNFQIKNLSQMQGILASFKEKGGLHANVKDVDLLILARFANLQLRSKENRQFETMQLEAIMAFDDFNAYLDKLKKSNAKILPVLKKEISDTVKEAGMKNIDTIEQIVVKVSQLLTQSEISLNEARSKIKKQEEQLAAQQDETSKKEYKRMVRIEKNLDRLLTRIKQNTENVDKEKYKRNMQQFLMQLEKDLKAIDTTGWHRTEISDRRRSVQEIARVLSTINDKSGSELDNRAVINEFSNSVYKILLNQRLWALNNKLDIVMREIKRIPGQDSLVQRIKVQFDKIRKENKIATLKDFESVLADMKAVVEAVRGSNKGILPLFHVNTLSPIVKTLEQFEATLKKDGNNLKDLKIDEPKQEASSVLMPFYQ